MNLSKYFKKMMKEKKKILIKKNKYYQCLKIKMNLTQIHILSNQILKYLKLKSYEIMILKFMTNLKKEEKQILLIILTVHDTLALLQ